MRLYRLERIQHLPVCQIEAWQFFSNPINLPEITPPWLSFSLTQKVPISIHAGMIISYRLKPFLGLPVTCISEITHVCEPDYFVDEQRFGPYKFWHHQHLFNAVSNGTQVIDIVHYAIAYGILGRLAHRSIVSPRLDDIFDYRHEELKKIFH
jgi:ligand-binding SRPBCC domain-containing protein